MKGKKNHQVKRAPLSTLEIEHLQSTPKSKFLLQDKNQTDILRIYRLQKYLKGLI